MWSKRYLLSVVEQERKPCVTMDHGCNARAGTIRLNTELVKKPKDLMEYVILHEMLHLIEPTHGARFVALLDKHFPSWREARAELNELPLAAHEWVGGYTR